MGHTGAMRKLCTLIAALAVVLAACEFVPPAGQSVTFVDEFGGTTIDLDKWNLGWFGDNVNPTDGANSAEDACWDPDHMWVANSRLHLSLTDADCPVAGEGTFPWTGAGLSTVNSFATSSSTIHAEAKIRFPGSTTFYDWPAFWINGNDGCWPQFGEMDIAEGLGATSLKAVTHYGTTCDASTQFQSTHATANDGGFHVYTVDTRPVSGSCLSGYTRLELTYKRDGNLTGVHTACMDISGGFYVIFNLTCSDEHGGPCVNGSTMSVEYVGVSEG